MVGGHCTGTYSNSFRDGLHVVRPKASQRFSKSPPCSLVSSLSLILVHWNLTPNLPNSQPSQLPTFPTPTSWKICCHFWILVRYLRPGHRLLMGWQSASWSGRTWVLHESIVHMPMPLSQKWQIPQLMTKLWAKRVGEIQKKVLKCFEWFWMVFICVDGENDIQYDLDVICEPLDFGVFHFFWDKPT